MDRLRSLGARLSRALGPGDAASPPAAAPPASPYRAPARSAAAEPRLLHEASQWIAALAADDTGLYLVEDARILHIAEQRAPRVIASIGAWPSSLAVDDDHVYWT